MTVVEVHFLKKCNCKNLKYKSNYLGHTCSQYFPWRLDTNTSSFENSHDGDAFIWSSFTKFVKVILHHPTWIVNCNPKTISLLCNMYVLPSSKMHKGEKHLQKWQVSGLKLLVYVFQEKLIFKLSKRGIPKNITAPGKKNLPLLETSCAHSKM